MRYSSGSRSDSRSRVWNVTTRERCSSLPFARTFLFSARLPSSFSLPVYQRTSTRRSCRSRPHRFVQLLPRSSLLRRLLPPLERTPHLFFPLPFLSETCQLSRNVVSTASQDLEVSGRYEFRSLSLDDISRTEQQPLLFEFPTRILFSSWMIPLRLDIRR